MLINLYYFKAAQAIRNTRAIHCFHCLLVDEKRENSNTTSNYLATQARLQRAKKYISRVFILLLKLNCNSFEKKIPSISTGNLKEVKLKIPLMNKPYWSVKQVADA